MNSAPTQPLLTRTLAHISTHTTAAAAAILWTAALAWYAYRIIPHTPHAAVAIFDFGETMLLALACIAFQLAALRVGVDHLTRIWRATIAPAAETPNPARWRAFGWIGAASWCTALAIGAPIIATNWQPDSTDLIFALVIVLIPAVQCTGAAVVGPILTYAVQERETALEARMRIRAAAQAPIRGPRKARHHGVR